MLSTIFAAMATFYQQRFRLPWPSLIGVFLSFVVLAAEVLAPAFAASVARLKCLPWWLIPACWFLPYVLYASGTGDWSAPAGIKVLSLALLPLLYRLVPVRHLTRFSWQDAVFSACLVTFVLSHTLRGIWNVPVHLDFLERFFLIAVATWTWTLLRPVPQLRYQAHPDRKVLIAAGRNFLFFACCALPLGFFLRFNAWHPRWHGLAAFCLDYLEIFLFIALLEETFFRGFLQTLLTGTWNSWWKAQLFVSALFGLFHILHAPFPNWRYVLLATLAGWFYGSAFRQGGSLLASTLVHAIVDAVWRTWFTAP